MVSISNLHNTKVVDTWYSGSANNSGTFNFKDEDCGTVTKQVRPDYYEDSGRRITYYSAKMITIFLRDERITTIKILYRAVTDTTIRKEE